MDVVLGNGWPGVMLHEAVGHGLEGDFNRKKTSAFCRPDGHGRRPRRDRGRRRHDRRARRGSITIDDDRGPGAGPRSAHFAGAQVADRGRAARAAGARAAPGADRSGAGLPAEPARPGRGPGRKGLLPGGGADRAGLDQALPTGISSAPTAGSRWPIWCWSGIRSC